MVSPGVTPSPRARRRRRRRGVAPSVLSSDESSLTSSFEFSVVSSVSATSLPPRRRPRPPRRRRRRASSLSSPDLASVLTTSAFTGFSTLAFATTGAAWKSGTGTDFAAFFVVFFSSVLAVFLAARFFGAFGSSAI